MKKLGYVVLLSTVLTGGASAQKASNSGSSAPWNYDSSSNTLSTPAGSRAAIGTLCPVGAPGGSVCMNGQVMTPVAVSALPVATSGNANLIQLVSSTTNCTSTGGTNPMLCISSGAAWVPLGGGTAAPGGLSQANLVTGDSSCRGHRRVRLQLRLSFAANLQLGGAFGTEVLGWSTVWATVGTTLTDLCRRSQRRLGCVQVAGHVDAADIWRRLQLRGRRCMSGVQYTLSVYVASNTGAAQTMRMADNKSTTPANMTIPGDGLDAPVLTWTANSVAGGLRDPRGARRGQRSPGYPDLGRAVGDWVASDYVRPASVPDGERRRSAENGESMRVDCRGHRLHGQLGGKLYVGGWMAADRPVHGHDLRRGEVDWDCGADRICAHSE